MDLTIVGQDGWKKPVKCDRAVLRIGSAASNDVQLSSPGISPIHLQIISAPENPASCQVLNLGPAVPWLSGQQETRLEPYATANLREADQLVLGEYRLLFHLPLSTGVVLASRQIAAALFLEQAVLHPDRPTNGILKLHNLGTQPNCQFQVAVQGLPEACYRLDPLPILYPGAEEEIRLQLFHRGTLPPAGRLTLTVSVSAPASYPGELVVLQQNLSVSPALVFKVDLADDLPVPKAESPSLPALPETEPRLPVSQPELPQPTPLGAELAGPEPIPAREAFAPALPVQKDLSSAKVVRQPAETYWDEGS